MFSCRSPDKVGLKVVKASSRNLTEIVKKILEHSPDFDEEQNWKDRGISDHKCIIILDHDDDFEFSQFIEMTDIIYIHHRFHAWMILVRIEMSKVNATFLAL